MKSKQYIFSILLASGLGMARLSALDLTPSYGFRELEGAKIPVVFFKDDARTVQWQPPAEWKITGDEASLALLPAGKSNARMELRIVSRKAAEAPDGKADPQAAADWVQPLLPVTAEKASFVREIPSPFLLGGLSSREITFSYNYLARQFNVSVALVNLDLEHSLAVIIYAPSQEFTIIHEEGTKSMFRWIWLDLSAYRIRADTRASRNSALEK